MWAIGFGVDEIPKEDIAEFLATVGELIVSWSNVESRLDALSGVYEAGLAGIQARFKK